MTPLPAAAGWSEELSLGDPAIDRAHRALFAELERLVELPSEPFAAAFEVAVAALERDFRAEEDLMDRLGFPGVAAHREQHARALAGLHVAAASLATGEAAARRAVLLLAQWLYLHITTMDRALAAAVQLARTAPAAPAAPG